MIGNYLLIALRNLRKNFSYSLINISGLGLGLATCLLLSLWIRHELSYDKFHTQIDQLYRVSLEYSFGGQTSKNSVSPTIVLPTLLKNYEDVENGVRFYNPGGYRPIVVKNEDKMFEETRFFYGDSTFFDVFTFKMLQGDAKKSLVAPNSIVVTESTARKYFGTTDVLGKFLKVSNRTDFAITGVLEDLPSNSMIQFDMIASFSTLDAAKENIWWSANYQTYVVLSPKANVQELSDKFNVLVHDALASELSGPGDYVKYNFMPMKDLYLRSEVEEPELTGSIDYVYIFSAIAGLILLIACINYVNLATARAADRAKEVGVRKVIGAARQQLITQFMGESIVITSLAFMLALFLSSASLPIFNTLTGKHFTQAMILDPSFLLVAIVALMIIALLAGLYPALVITGFKPVNILKGNFKTSGRGVWLRKSLVVFQFTVSIVLVIGTMVILKQVDFIRSKKLGYERENVITMPLDRKTTEVFDQFRTELLRNGHISYVGRAGEPPVRIQGGYSVMFPGSSERGMITTAVCADEDFVPALGIEVIAGRNFSKGDFDKLEKDTVASFILNESAVRELGLEIETAVGKPLNMSNRKGPIVGVVRDFHFASMHERISPLIIFTEPWQLNHIFIKVTPGNTEQALADLKQTSATLIPHRPFEYHFLNERFDALYQSEMKMGSVTTTFAALAIIIACLGLLGLVAFAAAQKTKEIGIRKVMGASAPSIILLITKDFILLVATSIVIGIPLSYFLMEDFWLVNFVYRTSIGIGPSIFAGVGCVLIAFLTASYQAVKASMINPANTLRNE